MRFFKTLWWCISIANLITYSVFSSLCAAPFLDSTLKRQRPAKPIQGSFYSKLEERRERRRERERARKEKEQWERDQSQNRRDELRERKRVEREREQARREQAILEQRKKQRAHELREHARLERERRERVALQHLIRDQIQRENVAAAGGKPTTNGKLTSAQQGDADDSSVSREELSKLSEKLQSLKNDKASLCGEDLARLYLLADWAGKVDPKIHNAHGFIRENIIIQPHGNTALGDGAFDASTTSSANTAMGYNALSLVTEGSNNVAVGYQAGGALVTGDNNIYLGSGVDASSAAEDNTMRLGDGRHSVYIPGLINNGVAHGRMLLIDSSGKVGSSSASGSSMAVDDLTVTDSFTVNGVLTARHVVDAQSLLSVVGQANLKSDLSVTGSATVQDELRVEGVTLVNDALTVTGSQVVVGAAEFSSTTQFNDISTHNAAVTINSVLQTSGNVNVGADLTVTDSANINGNLLAGGTLNVSGNSILTSLMVTGTIDLEGSINSTSSNNVIFGTDALDSVTSGSNNIAIGSYALSTNTTGTNNIAMGYNALGGNETGSSNIAFGEGALESCTTGTANIAIGARSGSGLVGGRNNIYLGTDVAAVNPEESNVVRIGTMDYQCYIPADTIFLEGLTNSLPGSGTAVLMNPITGELETNASSRRFKRAIKELEEDGELLEKLLQLNPVSFIYKNDKKNGKQYGLIAEEVLEIFPEIIAYDASGAIRTVRYDQFTGMLIHAFQSLHDDYEELDERCDALESKQEKQQDKIDELESSLIQALAELEKYKKLDTLFNAVSVERLIEMDQVLKKIESN